MKSKRKFIVVSVILIALLSLVSVNALLLPFERYGQAYLDDNPIEDGITITSWIDGVQYGNTKTFLGNGSFTLTTNGDQETDTSCKYGGVNGDEITYRVQIGSSTYIADESDIFETGEAINGDLHFYNTSQPNTRIKINELVCEPKDGGNQYIYIYYEGNIDLDRWRLENHDGFSSVLSSLHTRFPSEHNDLLYVNLGSGDVLNFTADELMLSWDPSGTGINENKWVVMDRVEYGNQSIQPDNTTLIDHPESPGLGEGLVRKEKGLDNNNCLLDFTIRNETGRPYTQDNPPELKDITTGNPTTGEDFNLRVNVTDDEGVDSVYVNYWFDDNDRRSEQISKEDSDWSHRISINNNATTLHYFFRANDTGDNWNRTDELTLDISDNDKPTAILGQDRTLKLGDTISLNASRSFDNIGISNFTWSIDDEKYYGEDLTYTLDKPVNYQIILNVTDKAGNYDTDMINVTVRVKISTIFELNMVNQATTGDEYTFNISVSENITVQTAYIYYQVDEDEADNSTMTNVDGNFYEYTLTIPDNGVILEYNISIIDDFDNWYQTGMLSLDIKDNDKPKVELGSNKEIELGNKIDFEIYESEDNIGITEYIWKIENNTFYGEQVEYEFTSPGAYKVTVKVKDEANNTDRDSLQVLVFTYTKVGPVKDANDKIVEDLAIILKYDGEIIDENTTDEEGIVYFRVDFKPEDHFTAIIKHEDLEEDKIVNFTGYDSSEILTKINEAQPDDSGFSPYVIIGIIAIFILIIIIGILFWKR